MLFFRRSFSVCRSFGNTMKFIGTDTNFEDFLDCFLKFLMTFNIYNFRFSDIGANLTDGMFQGIYNGSQKHPDDLDIVLERAWTSGLDKIIVTVGSINDHADAVKLVKKDGEKRFLSIALKVENLILENR